jgi:purine nucleoside permease
VDYDLGHHADSSELKDPEGPTWFHDDTLDDYAYMTLDRDLTDRIYELTKDIKLETTDQTRKAMKETFGDEEWADRGPKVIKGTDVTGDNFWKGEFGDRNAKFITETYGMPDPFAITDMEEIGMAVAASRLGMKDRYIAIRTGVNMDVFLKGETPENLWSTGQAIISNNSDETLDIFPVAMVNNYKVVSAVIKAIENGEL